jgi:hypothetical protein
LHVSASHAVHPTSLYLVRRRQISAVSSPSLVPDVILGTSGRCVEDMTEEKRMRSITQALIVGTVCLFSTQALAQGTPAQTRTPDASAQQLRRDLEIMKEQMRQMQEKVQ